MGSPDLPQGNEVDVHNVHWHGLVSEWDGVYVDQYNLLPSVSTSAQLIADNPGTWLLHCHVRTPSPLCAQTDAYAMLLVDKRATKPQHRLQGTIEVNRAQCVPYIWCSCCGRAAVGREEIFRVLLMILYVYGRQWRQALAGAQVNLHFSSGMQALFTVTGDGQKGFEQTGVTRTYYIQVRLIRMPRHLAWLEDSRQLSCQFLVA